MLTVAPTTDIATCHALRRVVFIEEQNVDEALEVDGLDERALHVLARLDGLPVGCARILLMGDTAKIGRVCVLGTHRGKGIGQALMRAALELAQAQPGVRRAKLGSQVHALGFYESLGFVPVGEVYMEAGIAHRDMLRAFSA
ncbi:GNAT family N-acetyltransferase [Roseibaca sp. Y0-43]|uniref:GNAT family N-acetyltransferase n=1 Tax=Roseibaca sp. Y0-43 TaxID=2816854 RepID=UPI001D0C4599|nr:GNAT family N-acetyltransferase [Roseibaca sp. Y0-43]MCC1482236.1 GNAT family N-acetyltransferase [Roseibaca sp. Y0-43]